MRHSVPRLSWVLALALGLTPALAGGAGGDAEVYVYTNADLDVLVPANEEVDALEPIPTAAPVPGAGEEDWEFVVEFLRAQHARIDADREHALERARTEARLREIEAAERRRSGEYRGYYPYVFYGFGHFGHRGTHHVHREPHGDEPAAGRSAGGRPPFRVGPPRSPGRLAGPPPSADSRRGGRGAR